MSLIIEKTNDIATPANFLAQSVLKQLNLGKSVLWFVTGGSSIAVAVEAAKVIAGNPHGNLTVTLTDERYGAPGHPDSNWQQLLNKGFSLPQAKMLPLLDGENAFETIQRFNSILEEELGKNSFKIGLFGVGVDGHTAGILPKSGAVDSMEWAFYYKAPQFERMTITTKTILKLDEAVVFMKGEEKWKVLEDLQKDKDVLEQPAQTLKKIPSLTIFSDYNK